MLLCWNRYGLKYIFLLCVVVGVEFVFNLIEEVAYGCLRVFRFLIGLNGYFSELCKSMKGVMLLFMFDLECVV